MLQKATYETVIDAAMNLDPAERCRMAARLSRPPWRDRNTMNSKRCFNSGKRRSVKILPGGSPMRSYGGISLTAAVRENLLAAFEKKSRELKEVGMSFLGAGMVKADRAHATDRTYSSRFFSRCPSEFP
jgi:hypothetical protein